jgi:pantetheine-phosphate adenylyltransferase
MYPISLLLGGQGAEMATQLGRDNSAIPKKLDAEFVIRGLRAITDFEYELQMAQTNRIMSPDTDTIFLTTNLKYAYLNSTTVKEVASYGGDISKFVPEFVAGAVMAKYSNR